MVLFFRLAQEEPLDKHVEALFYEVLDDLRLDENQKIALRPFTVTGFNTFQAGIPNKFIGSIIGIPTNYTYKDKFAIDTSQIRIGYNQDSLNIHHPATQDLIESLVLSDEAKKFGIAREIVMSEKNLPMYYGYEALFLGSVSPFAIDYMATKLNLYSKPLPVPILFYGASGLIVLTVWLQIRDILHTYFEKQVDKELALLGQDYVRGGKEFYDKLLKRNVALRTLLGIQGAKMFNRDGDEIFFIRQKRTPITYRKKFFSQFKIDEEQTAEPKLFL